MSCCENTTCVQVFLNDCTNEIILPLEADMPGLWRVMSEFNGAWIRQLIQLSTDDKITLENTFNANYTHLVQIFRPDGTLFNNTCYSFDMSLVIDTLPLNIPVTTDVSFIFKDSPDYNTGDGTPQDPYQLQTGLTVVIPRLYGQTVHQLIDYNAGREFIPWYPNTTTLDRTANGGFIENDTMTISYEKLAD